MSEAAAAGAASVSPASGSQAATQAPAQGPGVAKSNAPAAQAANPKGQVQQGAPGSSSQQTNAETVQQLKELAEDNLDAVVKIKINGQVRQVTVKEALKLAEKGEGADQKFQRAAQIEREAQQLSRLAKENPEEFLRKWGIDPDEYSQARLAKLLEEQMLTPEQKELRDLKKYREESEKEKQDRLAREKQDKEQSEFKAADQQYRNEVFQAWQTSGLPAHPSFGVEIAKEMIRANAQGHPLTAQQAAARVKEDWIANTGSILDQMDAEGIFQALPKAVHEKLRSYYVRQVSGQPGQSGAKLPGSQAPRPGESPASTQNKSSGKKMLSEKEYREYFSKLKG